MATWIFQGSPDKFDIEGYLAAGLEKITWMVTRYADRIQPGDLVYIWQAAGKKKATSGIIASAIVISEVWSGVDDEAAVPFWKVEGAESDIAERVWLRVLKVSNRKEIIKRDWLSKDPICKDLLIVRQSAGTNYPVSPPHAQRLASLWAKTGVTWSRGEAIAALRVYEQTYEKPISKIAGSPVADLAVLCGRAVGAAYNKVLNFRAIDPRDDRAGLKGAGDGDRSVWTEFYRPASQTLDVEALNKAFQEIWSQTTPVKPDKPEPVIKTVSPRMRLVAVEAATKESFPVASASGSQPRVATRSESLLVADFNQWLRKSGVECCSALYKIPGGTLRSDLFIQEWNLLMEAKASNSRENIRTAIGQLFDYRRFHDSDPGLAILVPEKPEEDLVELLEGLGFIVWFRESDGFATTTLSPFQRKLGDKRGE